MARTAGVDDPISVLFPDLIMQQQQQQQQPGPSSNQVCNTYTQGTLCLEYYKIKRPKVHFIHMVIHDTCIYSTCMYNHVLDGTRGRV